MEQGEAPSKQIKNQDSNALDQLKKFTIVVADTSEFNLLKQFNAEDATTNPSLILQAADKPEYAELINSAIKYAIDHYNTNQQVAAQKQASGVSGRRSSRAASGRKSVKSESSAVEQEEKKPAQAPAVQENNTKKTEEIVVEKADEFKFESLNELERAEFLSVVVDKLIVGFGKQILDLIPGVVSSEVDARLSFDKNATINRAKRIIQMYEEIGIPQERVLIQIASTWEGIEAAQALKKDQINCNLTLLFSFAQAIACAEAGVRLISPFVGRILDWHKAQNKDGDFDRHKDPGVISVTQIYNYYKKFGYETIVMGASFRNIGEIIELAGCDKLTISPQLLDELQNLKGVTLKRLLDKENLKDQDIQQIDMDEQTFRWMHNDDPMATEQLSEGIRNFAIDTQKLEKKIIAIIEGAK